MATRIRSFLIDNTLSRVFTNIIRASEANAANVIAGATKQRLTLAALGTSVVVRVANNLIGRGNGYQIVTSTLITGINLTLKRAAVGGQGIRVVLKLGTTYAGAISAGTFTIPSGSINVTIATGILVEAGQNIYMDVISTGISQPGVGLTVFIDYFSA